MWQEYHSLHPFQSRYYLNPFTSKLEIIPLDFGYGSNIKSKNYLDNYDIFYKIIKNNTLLKSSILHRDFEKYFYKTFFYIKKNFDDFYNLREKYCKGFINHCEDKIKLNSYFLHLDFLINNYKQVIFHLRSNISKTELINFDTINNITNNKLLKFINNNTFIDVLNYNNKFIEIKNLSPFELKIIDLNLIEKYEGETTKFNLIKNINIEGSDNSDIKKLKVNINQFNKDEKFELKNQKHYKLFVNYKIKNIDKKYIKNIYPIFNNNYRESSVKQNFVKKKGDDFLIQTGEWNVNHPIIIKNNRNLIIEKNTKLRFSDNSYIFLEGGSLIVKGENENEVILTSKNKLWKGIYINNNNNPNNQSNLNFTIIKNVGYFEGKHNSLTGSVNFYRSNIKIQNSQFIGNQSEDALNAESNLDIKNCKFKNISSDALDSDFQISISRMLDLKIFMAMQLIHLGL